jgi:hypothetical protein
MAEENNATITYTSLRSTISVSPNKMATTDGEGNYLSKSPLNVNICSCGPLLCMCPARSPIKMADIDQEGNNAPKFPITMRSPPPPPPPSPVNTASLVQSPASTPCTRLGVLPAAGHSPLSPLLVGDLAKVCKIAVKTKQQLTSAQMKIKKLTKVLKSSKRREDSMLSIPPAHVKMINMATQLDEAPGSSLSNNWASLLLQLRSQSSSQLQDMRATIADKDNQLMSQKKEIREAQH